MRIRESLVATHVPGYTAITRNLNLDYTKDLQELKPTRPRKDDNHKLKVGPLEVAYKPKEDAQLRMKYLMEVRGDYPQWKIDREAQAWLIIQDMVNRKVCELSSDDYADCISRLDPQAIVGLPYKFDERIAPPWQALNQVMRVGNLQARFAAFCLLVHQQPVVANSTEPEVKSIVRELKKLVPGMITQVPKWIDLWDVQCRGWYTCMTDHNWHGSGMQWGQCIYTVKSANYPPLMMPQGWGDHKWPVMSPMAYHLSMYVYRTLKDDKALKKDNRKAITDHMKLYPGENSIGAGGSGSSSDPPPPPDPDPSDDGAGVLPPPSDPPAPNDPPTQDVADDLNAIADGEVINDSFQAHVFATNQAARESVAKKPGSAEKHTVGFMFLVHKKAQSNM
jgi:hypothetical protein